jgi:hypothetical protein
MFLDSQNVGQRKMLPDLFGSCHPRYGAPLIATRWEQENPAKINLMSVVLLTF